MAGLQGQHKGSQPRTVTPTVQARILRRAQQKPSDGSTHWSCRKLATALGLSKTTVQRVLAQPSSNHIGSNDTWPVTIRNLRRRPPTSLAYI
jgi:response regulator of citrate/malate metabolism